MKFSKLTVFLFFIGLLSIGWFIYPRHDFLGYIFEGFKDLQTSKEQYLSYLEKKPHSRFAVIRLSKVYEKLGEPDNAIQVLENLVNHRKYDVKLADLYLNLLEDYKYFDELFEARLKIAKQLHESNRVSIHKVLELYENSLEYALWNQKFDRAYEIARQLKKLDSSSKDYSDLIRELDRGFQKTNKIAKDLEERIKNGETDSEIYNELAEIYILTDQNEKALEFLNQAIDTHSQDRELLELRFTLFEKTKKFEEAINDVLKILNLTELDNHLREKYERNLAELFNLNNQKEKALQIFQSLLMQNPNNPQNWILVIDQLGEIGQNAEQIDLLEKFIQKFPENRQKTKELAEIYFYENQNLEKLDFYWEYILENQNINFGIDVAYLLIEKKQEKEALSWLDKLKHEFGSDYKIVKTEIDLYTKNKEYDLALDLTTQLLTTNPADVSLWIEHLSLAQITENKQEIDHSVAALKLLDIKNEAQLLNIASELFYASYYEDSLFYLNQIIKTNPENIEALILISQLYKILDDKNNSLKFATNAESVLKSQNKKSKNWDYQWLKVRSLIKIDENLKSDYSKILKKNPENKNLNQEYIDILIEDKDFESAQNQINYHQNNFPDELASNQYNQARLETAKGNYEQAYDFLEKLHQAYPNQTSYKKDLAYVSYKSGLFNQARSLYEDLSKNGDEDSIQILDEMNQIYDHRIYSFFKGADFGSSEIWEWGLGYYGFQTDEIKIGGELAQGFFNSDILNFSDQAYFGNIFAESHHHPDWIFKIGPTFGISDFRKTGGALFEIDFKPDDKWHAELNYSFRQLRKDIVEAIPEGHLYDVASLKGDFQASERIQVSAEYEFSRNYLSDGSKAYENHVETTVNYVLFKKPFVALGYQFSYSDLEAEAGFISQVPLLLKVNAHYINFYFEQIVSDIFKFQSGFFVGADPSRNLKLQDLDLWGARSSINLQISSFIDLESGFEYGKETLSTVSGQSYQFNFRISGHWH